MLSSNLDLGSEIIRANQYLHKQYEDIEKAENSLSEFIKQAWHVIEPSAPYIHGWHIDAIAEHLEAATRGEITRLLTNVPPGTMKSLINNVFWPAWEWGAKKLPHYRILCASHTMNLSVRDNLKMRRLVSSNWYRERYPHVKLMKDQNAKSKFENSMTGFREAMAIASLTGSRGNRVQIDDPLSVDDANSVAKLDQAEFVLCEVIPTRLVDPMKSFIGVVMQRLHERDTSGIILAKELGYVHLMLPMEFEITRKCITSIGFSDPRTEDGELLFPDRFPAEVVERDKKSLGIYGTAGQLQQRPSPRGGGLIKVEWFKRFKLKFDERGNIDLREYKLIYLSWDTAFKEGEENDYSVCQVWGVKDNGYYLLFQFRQKVNYPDLEEKAVYLGKLFKANGVLIEDKASGQSLVQSLKKKTMLPIKAIKTDRDKVSRVHASSDYFESGRIFVPEDEIWVEDYISELTTFPAGAHDDQVDATTQFLMEIALRREVKNAGSFASSIGR